MARMDEINQDTLRILKHHQYWMVYSGLLKLQRQLHKSVLSPLKPKAVILIWFQGPPSGSRTSP